MPHPPAVEIPSPSQGRRFAFEIRVGWLLLGAALIGFGPIAALAVVASIQDADALSTIALALAIVAFAIQILVFVVQTQTASNQMLQSERLNTQTRELLAEVNTAVGSTQTMVGEQFRYLLQAFAEGASKTAAETGKFDPEQFEQRLMTNIQEATQRPPEPEPRPSDARPVVTAPRRVRDKRAAEKKRELAHLAEFPSEEEGKKIAAEMRNLSADGRRRLRELGEDEISSHERRRLRGAGGRSPGRSRACTARSDRACPRQDREWDRGGQTIDSKGPSLGEPLGGDWRHPGLRGGFDSAAASRRR